MPRDTTDGRGRWKATKSAKPAASRKQARKWGAVAVLGLMLGATVVVLINLGLKPAGWGRPKTHFIPFWVGRYKQERIAPVAWIDADRRAFREGGYFSRLDDDDFKDRTSGTMENGIDALGKLKSNDGVVVHISGYAVVSDVAGDDEAGPIRILATDSNPSEVGMMFPLRAVLRKFAACPSPKKLLILDIMKPRLDLYDLGGMGTADGVADLVRGEVERFVGAKDDADPRSKGLILLACGEGQSTVRIDSLGGSLFNHHLLAGLEDADADGNDRITVKELAAYLVKVVDRDARHYRGLRQTPRLLGRGDDFELVSVGAGRREKPAPSAGSAPKEKEEPPAAKEKGDENAKEPAKGAEKAETKDKEKGQPAGKEGTSEESQDPRAYPGWLAAEWAWREASWDAGHFADIPRPFRAFEAHLIRAEQRWRGGEESAKIEAETRREIAEIKEWVKKDREDVRLTPRSVGQARSLGWKPDAALVAELQGVFRGRRLAGQAPMKPEQNAAAIDAAVKAFLAKLNTSKKVMLDLAGAMVEVLDSADEQLDADTVKFADLIVEQALKADPNLKRDVIELMFLSQLARRAEVRGVAPWSKETARRAWDVVVDAERANCRPRSFAWVENLLDEADSYRHQAEVLTLPATAGFTSWKRLAETWDEARSAYDFIADCQDRIEDACAMLARAYAFLPADIAYLETSHRPDLEERWLEAAGKARSLARLLDPPSAVLTRETISPLRDKLAEATQELAALLEQLQAPFDDDTIKKLARDCEDEGRDPDPAQAVEIEAILATPFPRGRERQVLWDAARKLDARLAKGRAPDQAGDVDPSDRDRARESVAADRANARARRLAALVRLAGDEKAAEEMDAVWKRVIATAEGRRAEHPSASNGDEALATWRMMAVRCANVRRELKTLLGQKDRDDDLAAWVAPAYDLNWKEQEGRGRRDKAVIAWLGRRYRHEKDDSRGPEARAFYDELAAGEAPAEDVHPELTSDAIQGSKRPSLAADRGRGEVPFRIILRALEAAGSRKVLLRVLKPDDDRLGVTLVGDPEITLMPQVPRDLTAQVEWNEGRTPPEGPAAAPNGFIIQAKLEDDDRTYHLPVPLSITPESEQLQLVLSSAPDPLTERSFDLRLRVLRPKEPGAPPPRQPVFVYVRNPSATPRNVHVEILEADTVVQKTAKPLAVAARDVAKVPAFGAAPIPPTEPLHALAEPTQSQLQIRLKDAETGDTLQTRKLAVDLASPREYLEVIGSQFIPTQPGEPNRLELKFRARPDMMTPAAPLAMALDKGSIPALVEIFGEEKLEGLLEPRGETTLYAKGIRLDIAKKNVGLIPVDVDALKRAFWFQARFEQAGGPRRAVLDDTPRISFEATPVLAPGKPARLKVAFRVDNAPPGARLKWQLGQIVNEKVVNDISPFEDQAKDRRIGFDARGPDGALLFEASLKDWDREFEIPNIRGKHRLQARLLKADGRTQIADAWTDMVLDDRPPSGIVLALPKEVKPKRMMAVVANIPPPLSGLKEVDFYIGNQDDFKKVEAEKKFIRGKQRPDDPRVWEANLTVPETASGTLVVSVRALSTVGLAGFDTKEVEVIPPKAAAGPDEEDEAKAAMPKFGEIVGKVVEGNRPQPNLTVELYTYMPKAGTDPKIAEAKTDKDGKYSFEKLEPGTYAVRCFHPGSSSVDTQKIILKAGDSKTVTLELKR